MVTGVESGDGRVKNCRRCEARIFPDLNQILIPVNILNLITKWKKNYSFMNLICNSFIDIHSCINSLVHLFTRAYIHRHSLLHKFTETPTVTHAYIHRHSLVDIIHRHSLVDIIHRHSLMHTSPYIHSCIHSPAFTRGYHSPTFTRAYIHRHSLVHTFTDIHS